MRKWVVLAAWAVVAALGAMPVGDPAFPKIIQQGFFIPKSSSVSVRSGYEGDFVSDARFQQYNQGVGRVDSYQQDTNSGTVTINFLNRLDIYTVLGSSRVVSDWRFTDLAGIVHRVELETMYDFLWGLGARAILYEWGNVCLGVGGRYEQSDYGPVWMTVDGAAKSANGTLLHWSEWQIDLAISYAIDIFTPYLGVTYTNAKATLGTFTMAIAGDDSGNNSFKNRTPVGVCIGCSLSTSKFFMLNVEGRLIDEEAVTISGDFRF
ncbi:MAG: hypothetical protein KGJ02_00070 [Verrucomicrobiota bacterium]|nr:hypothetical protein [Verrucomicrobiota bacterium]